MTFKKLLTMAAALLIGGGSLWAQTYTTKDLTSAGWSQVTDLSSMTLSDYYFAIVSNDNTNLMIKLAPGYDDTATTTTDIQTDHGLWYMTGTDPLRDNSFLWTLETNSTSGYEGYTMRNVNRPVRVIQTTENKPWYCRTNWETSPSNKWSSYAFTLADGAYTIQALANGGTNYLGLWTPANGYVSGQVLAGNKSSSDIGKFLLYSIPKTTANAKILAASDATATDPYDLAPALFGRYTGNYTGPTGYYGAARFCEKYVDNEIPSTGDKITKTIKNAPNGYHTITVIANAAWISGRGSVGTTVPTTNDNSTVLTINGVSQNVPVRTDGAYNPVTLVYDNIKVTDNTINLALTNNDAAAFWFVLDVKSDVFVAPTIESEAVALPADGAMDADTWYYYSLPTTDEYDFTLTDAATLTYTQDGTQLISTATGTDETFTANEKKALSLSNGRLYFKTSAATTLTVSYKYNVGSATASIAEGSYQKALSTVTFDFTEAASNDPDATFAILNGEATATLKKSGSTIGSGTLSLSGTVLTATFSDVTLNLNSSYSIEVPAAIVGYASQVSNAAITVNFNTPIFADGDYYLKNKANDAYFAGGLSWGTQAITNSIGHIVNLTALSDGKYTIDSYLYNGGTSDIYHYLNGTWCDKAATGWSFVADGDYYRINDGTNNLTAGTVGTALTLADGTGDGTKWQLLTAAEWKAEQVARLDAATSSNGVDATFYIASPNFNRNDDLENAKWQGSPGIGGLDGNDVVCNYNAEKYNTTPFDVYQELTGLKPGVYKVTVDGFYRNGTTDDRNAYLYANDFEVALVNIRSANVTEQDDANGFTTANGDGETVSKVWVPDRQYQAALTFDNGYYDNELEFAVGPDGALRIGVKKTTGAASDWAVFDNFQLTYYGPLDYSDLQTAYNAVIVPTLGFEENESAPYNNVTNLTSIAAAKELLDNQVALLQSDITSATTAITNMTWTVNTTEVNAFYDGTFATQAPKDDGNDGTAVSGWTTNTSIRTLVKSGTEGTALYTATTGHSGMYVWNGAGATYGETDGYTVPLHANQIYTLSYKRGSWDSDGSSTYGSVSITGPDATTIPLVGESLYACKYNKDGGELAQQRFYFVAPVEGNYVFVFGCSGNTVFTDIQLYSVDNNTLEFDENNALPAYASGTYPNVQVARSIKAGYNTLVLPFSMTEEQVKETFGEGAKVYVVNKYENDNITFVSQTTINANEPCILVSEKNVTELNLANVAVSSATSNPTKEGTSVKMIGSYAASTEIEADANNYVVSAGELWLVEESAVSMKGTRAYIQLTVTGTAPSRLTWSFDGDATGIAELTKKTEATEGAIYNLQGQQLNSLQRGINIVNGKKVLVK